MSSRPWTPQTARYPLLSRPIVQRVANGQRGSYSLPSIPRLPCGRRTGRTAAQRAGGSAGLALPDRCERGVPRHFQARPGCPTGLREFPIGGNLCGAPQRRPSSLDHPSAPAAEEPQQGSWRLLKFRGKQVSYAGSIYGSASGPCRPPLASGGDLGQVVKIGQLGIQLGGEPASSAGRPSSQFEPGTVTPDWRFQPLPHHQHRQVPVILPGGVLGNVIVRRGLGGRRKRLCGRGVGYGLFIAAASACGGARPALAESSGDGLYLRPEPPRRRLSAERAVGSACGGTALIECDHRSCAARSVIPGTAESSASVVSAGCGARCPSSL